MDESTKRPFVDTEIVDGPGFDHIDAERWSCKSEGCDKTCDSHPCLIEYALIKRGAPCP